MAYTKKTWIDNESYADADSMNNIENGIYNNDAHIGDLNDLETDDKTNLVEAINEATTKGGGVPAGTIVDYDGPSVPDGWQATEDTVEAKTVDCNTITERFIYANENSTNLPVSGYPYYIVTQKLYDNYISQQAIRSSSNANLTDIFVRNKVAGTWQNWVAVAKKINATSSADGLMPKEDKAKLNYIRQLSSPISFLPKSYLNNVEGYGATIKFGYSSPGDWSGDTYYLTWDQTGKAQVGRQINNAKTVTWTNLN